MAMADAPDPVGRCGVGSGLRLFIPNFGLDIALIRWYRCGAALVQGQDMFHSFTSTSTWTTYTMEMR